MQQVLEQIVKYEEVYRIRGGPGSPRHHIFDVVISKLPKTLEVPISLGGLGINVLFHMSQPQPIGEHFSVVWNGDRVNPIFKFDGAPEKNARVRVEAWGT